MNSAPTAVKPRRARKKAEVVQPSLFEPVISLDEQELYSSPKKKRAKKVKKLEDYKRTRPAEIKLFGFCTPEERKYSNTIELYDFMPKYFWGKVERIHGEFLRPLEREFECRGTKYKVVVTPARIKDKDGAFRDYYPGHREEIVEAALRKLTCDGHGVFLDDHSGVIFSLTELRRELKRMGHTYSVDQIKEALLICAKTDIEIRTEDDNSILVAGMFQSLGLRSWEDWKEKGQQTKCFVQFNPLVTTSIRNGTFRRLNYERYMAYKSVISRQLHKRMSHHYTQASLANTYDILLSTIIRDFGLTSYEHLRDNLQKVKLALKELKDGETILDAKIEKVIDSKGKLLDAKFILRPHPRFAGEMIGANEIQRRIKSNLAQFPTTNIHNQN
jgi:hypothetical protein